MGKKRTTGTIVMVHGREAPRRRSNFVPRALAVLFVAAGGLLAYQERDWIDAHLRPKKLVFKPIVSASTVAPAPPSPGELRLRAAVRESEEQAFAGLK
jgi:hypothetical protein